VHKLLLRQLKRFFGSPAAVPDELGSFIAAVDEAYVQADHDRELLEHSMETVSAELIDRYDRLQHALAESRRTEEHLNGALSLVHATLDATTDGIVVLDADGNVVQMNRRFADIWSLPDHIAASQDSSVGLEFVLDQVEGPEQFLARVREVQAAPEEESFDVLRFKDGRVFERYSKPHTLDGATVGRVWSFRDVTERMRLEEQLRQSQKMEAVGSLAGGIAHDFNNLLTVIQGHAQLLLSERDLPEQHRADLDDIVEAGERAATLTRQLLAFSRKQILQPIVLDLNSVVRNLEPMLRRLIGEDFEIVTDLMEGPCTVTADAGQLEQVIMNLVVNARDASESGGRVEISTRLHEADDNELRTARGALPAGRYVSLAVRDDGPGIPRALQGRVFEPFFTTKAPGMGTGLGLATVYGIVRQSEGVISLHSDEGSGATFTVHLPHVTGASPSEVRRVSPAPLRGRETILLAEDEDGVRRFVQRALERMGYRVLAARDGHAAARLAIDHGDDIDLVLTDVVMPDGGGRELVEWMQARRPGISALYMSGYTDDEIVRRGVLQSRTRVLEKPIGPDDLARAVRQALDATG
jgi:PAS domain S-box-containing protein